MADNESKDISSNQNRLEMQDHTVKQKSSTELTTDQEITHKNTEEASRNDENQKEKASLEQEDPKDVKEDVNTTGNSPITTKHSGTTKSHDNIGKLADELVEKKLTQCNGKEDIINEILTMKKSIDKLVGNIRDTKMLSQKYDKDNQYLQEYVDTLMTNNEIKK